MDVRELLNRAGLSEVRDPDRIPRSVESPDGFFVYKFEWIHENVSVTISSYGITFGEGNYISSWYHFMEAYKTANGQFIPEHEQNRLVEIQDLIDNGTLLDWDFSSHPGKVMIWRNILGGDLIYTANDGWYYGYKTAQKPISNKEAMSVLTKLREIEGVLK